MTSNRKADTAAVTAPLVLPDGETVRSSLDRVLRLLSVGSKRFLTNKVSSQPQQAALLRGRQRLQRL